MSLEALRVCVVGNVFLCCGVFAIDIIESNFALYGMVLELIECLYFEHLYIINRAL